MGSPGTILTFFPWADAAPGRIGAGETQETAFAVPSGSLDAWELRLAEHGVDADVVTARFGQRTLAFRDPDGMRLALVEGAAGEGVTPWGGVPGLQDDMAVVGFAGVTLGVAEPAATASVLTDVLGWSDAGAEAGRRRLVAPGDGPGRIVDLVRVTGGAGRLGAGSVHHVAFRAASDADQAAMARELAARLRIGSTEQRDRNYFRSIYFRASRRRAVRDRHRRPRLRR